MITKSGGELGNALGLLFWHNIVKQDKDEKLKEQLIKDLDLSGDKFNEGFHKGIRGVKI